MKSKATTNKFIICIIPVILLTTLVMLSLCGKSFVREFPQTYDEYFAPVANAENLIKEVSLTAKSAAGYAVCDGVYIKNTAGVTVSAAQMNTAYKSEGAQVLIVHTHATECYSPQGALNYDPADNNRSTDTSENMIAVGNEFARVLEDAGIKCIHDTTLFDYPNYNSAYRASGTTIARYLEKNPSIRIVLDLHRDAIVDSELVKYRPVVKIADKSAAQIMFVVGASHDSWQQNLALAVNWQKQLESSTPGICRPINLRAGKYNQHLSTGGLLIEVGSTGNYLSEAIESARLCAKSLVHILNSN